jgi:hypothetical protein
MPLSSLLMALLLYQFIFSFHGKQKKMFLAKALRDGKKNTVGQFVVRIFVSCHWRK